MLNRSLSEGFGQLESLQKLDLTWCEQLRALPEGIPPCIITPSAALAIWARIGRGISSSVLLTCSLSEGFGQLERLEELNLTSCYDLKELPEGVPLLIFPLSAALAILALFDRDISSSLC